MIKPDFEVITKRISTKKDAHILGVGDLHIGTIEANKKGWEYFVQLILKDPLAYVIFVGDLMNNATKSSVSNVFEETMRPREQKMYLVEKLKPLAEAERILAIEPGNHEQRSAKDADDDPLYDVAAKLDIEDVYRENVALIKVVVGDSKNANAYSILAAHGAGGGALTGSSVNRYERYASSWDGVDIFMFGHTHKPFVTKPNKMVMDTLRGLVRQKKMVVMTVPSWLQYAGYPVRKLMSPVEQYDPDQPMGISLSGKDGTRRIKIDW